MKYVEFIGPSGSGKTTIRRALVDRIENAIGGTAARNRCIIRTLPMISNGGFIDRIPHPIVAPPFERIWRVLRPHYSHAFMVENPASLTAIGTLLDHVEQQYFLEWLFEWTARYTAYSRFARPGELVAVDDALFQYHLRLLVDDVWDADRLTARLPEPDVLVAVDMDAEICLFRQERRNRGRPLLFEGLDRRTAVAQLERWRGATNAVADSFERQGVNVVRVTADEPVEKLAATLARKVTIE